MLVKTHLITTDQWDEYEVKWIGRLIDANPELTDGLPTFVIASGKGRIEMKTVNLKQIEKQAKKHTYPRGRGKETEDKSFIYIKEVGGNEKLVGVVVHKHFRKYSPMYDEVG